MPDAPTTLAVPASAGGVDADRPWLGLLPFTEETQRFFFGRAEELREIFLRVRDQPLTVLYGQSGLGKSSLLGAGLIPQLRANAFRPILRRLLYEPDDPPLLAQVRGALAAACAGEGADAGPLLARWGEATLWECFHDARLRAERLDARPPVAIFDQFEEIFTLGQQRPREEIAAVATELADLLENRIPPPVRSRLAAEPDLAGELEFARSPLRVVITLREDYLSYLEAWKSALPSLMRNRMALHPLRGRQAWEAVFKPGNLDGRSLVSKKTATRIVKFVANRPKGVLLRQIEAVPPLLSLVCAELNGRRIKAGDRQILPYQLQGEVEEILSSFYDGCFAGLPRQARELVEQRLLSPAGFRESISLNSAIGYLQEAGVPRSDAERALKSLIDKRLLISEDRAGTRRLELTHDVLTRVAVRSRELARELAPKADPEAPSDAKGPRTINIFISSPGDVAEERDLARSVIEGLRRSYTGNLDLRAMLWEDMPLQADTSFQESVDHLISAGGIDIAIFILWTRLASPLGSRFLRPDGTEYRSGTEREWDLMLRAREASGGTRPQLLVYARNDDTSFSERLLGLTTHDQERLLQERTSVRQFITKEFHDAETGTNLRAYHVFDHPAAFAQRLRVHLRSLLDPLVDRDLNAPVWDIARQGSPFRGLRSFEFKHAPVFFGREDETLEVQSLLREEAQEGCAFALIVGASGSGKSSLVRAGVLPEIVKNGGDDGTTGWRTAVLTPGAGEGDPVFALARAIAPARDPAGQAELAAGLWRDPEQVCRTWLASDLQTEGCRDRLAVVVDQLEELFNDERIPAEARDRFLLAVTALARSGLAWVVAAVRSEFYPECHATLTRLEAHSGSFHLTPPGADALDRLIRQPAALAGLRFEQRGDLSLADAILRDAAQHPDALALVEFLLDGLYDQRADDGTLTFASYEAFGGLEGVLARQAEAVFARVNCDQPTFETVLAALVEARDDGQDSFVRRRAPLAELTRDAPSRAFVYALVEERLLTTEITGGGEPVAMVSHEGLFRAWPRAAVWLAGNCEFLQTRDRLEAGAGPWEEAGRDEAFLLAAGLALDQGRILLQAGGTRLSPRLVHYLEASIAHQHARERAILRRRRALLAALTALTVLAVLAAVWALVSQRRARESLVRAEESRLVVNMQREQAEASERIASTARDKAVASRHAAEELVAYMQHDLRDSLAQVGRLSLLESINDRIAKYQAENPPDSADLRGQQEQGVLSSQRGDVLLAQGNLTAALAAYREARSIAARLVQADPNQPAFQKDLGRSDEHLGDVLLAQGNLDAALKSYRESLAIAKRLAEQAPDDADLKDDLWVRYEKLGDALRAAADLTEARAAYEAALALAAPLARDDPDSAKWQGHLAASYGRLSVLLGATYDMAAAVEAARKSRLVFEKLAQADPGNIQRQQDLLRGTASLAGLLSIEGRLEEAEAQYLRSIDIAERLTTAIDPANVTWQRDLFVCLYQISALYEERNETQKALAGFEKALGISSRLAALDPTNKIWQDDMRKSREAVEKLRTQIIAKKKSALNQH